MSTLTEALAALRQALQLTEDVKRVGAALKEVTQELREHDRRITRLEAQWDTALQLSAIQGGKRQLPDGR